MISFISVLNIAGHFPPSIAASCLPSVPPRRRAARVRRQTSHLPPSLRSQHAPEARPSLRAESTFRNRQIKSPSTVNKYWQWYCIFERKPTCLWYTYDILGPALLTKMDHLQSEFFKLIFTFQTGFTHMWKNISPISCHSVLKRNGVLRARCQ